LRVAVLGVALLIAAACGVAGGSDQHEPVAPLAPPHDLDPSKVSLGSELFADPILSSRKTLSCIACHDLDTGGTINVKRTIGYQERMHRFNAPTIFNVSNNYRLGWRGEFTSLEDQNEKVLLDYNIMGATWPMLMTRLRESQYYSSAFQRIYGHQVERGDLLDVLATFQRSLVTPGSTFDRYISGDSQALNGMELEGYRLFKDYGCAACHQGSNVGGNMFQKFGIFFLPPADESNQDRDLGRFTLTGIPADKGVFRVPSLRNVGVTAPYFHDGRVASLPLAVSIMGRIQLGRSLAPRDIDALVAFLNTLTGEYNGHKLKSAPAEGFH
jgi:cytochrome c peroxidase